MINKELDYYIWTKIYKNNYLFKLKVNILKIYKNIGLKWNLDIKKDNDFTL